jgi:hypothetical protein
MVDIDDDAEETIGKKSKHGGRGEFGEEYRAKVNQMEKSNGRHTTY